MLGNGSMNSTNIIAEANGEEANKKHTDQMFSHKQMICICASQMILSERYSHEEHVRKGGISCHVKTLITRAYGSLGDERRIHV